MNSNAIGDSKIRVTSLGLGGGALGGLYKTVGEDEACETVNLAYEGGIRYFDTAPLYGHGLSEARVGKALEAFDRDSFSISTKVGVLIEPAPSGGTRDPAKYADPFLLEGRHDFSYDACMESIEASLSRLRTDHVEIVYIHDPDEGESALPPDERTGISHLSEVMSGAYKALSELRDEGVVGAIGVGLNGTDLLLEFARAGDFDCFLLAGRYTLMEQDGLEDLLPVCVEKSISIVVGGVFNSGILATGTAVDEPMYNYRPADSEVIERVRRLEDLCAEYGIALPSAALQYPLAHEAVAAVIPGARLPGEVRGNVAAASEKIPDGFWTDLLAEGLVDPQAPTPGNSTGSG